MKVTYAKAIGDALKEEMRRDSKVLIYGEDIAQFGNIFGITRGMLEEFGPMRRADLQERFEFSQATLLRILGRLKDKGLVRAEGNTRRRVYRVAVEGSSAAG